MMGAAKIPSTQASRSDRDLGKAAELGALPRRTAAKAKAKSGSAKQTTAPKHICSSFCTCAPSNALSLSPFPGSLCCPVVTMAADIPTLSRLLEASLDPRQNKQGALLFPCLLVVPHCPLPLAAHV